MIVLPKSINNPSLLSLFANHQVGPGCHHPLNTVGSQKRGREEVDKEVVTRMTLLFVDTSVDKEFGTVVVVLILLITMRSMSQCCLWVRHRSW
jgi:ornithine cyclodeaminase/alanine dehydrogenase-like protein (mu-crystallin family)